jgi:hypothetical protein
MIESPMLKRLMAERSHNLILALLKKRFGTVAQNTTKLLREVVDEKKLTKLNIFAGECPDLAAFREALLS